MAAVVAVGSALERTAELAIIGTNLLPVALKVAEQVVGSCKAPVAQLAHMRTRGWLQMSRLVSGQIGEVEMALRALTLFAGFPVLLGRLGTGGCRQRG